MTSQQFLEFILNCKNQPNLEVPVRHTRCRPNHTLATRVVDFYIKVSLTWLYTAIVLRTHSSRKVTKQCLIDNFVQFLKLSPLASGGNYFSSWMTGPIHGEAVICPTPSFTATLLSISRITMLLTCGTDSASLQVRGLDLGTLCPPWSRPAQKSLGWYPLPGIVSLSNSWILLSPLNLLLKSQVLIQKSHQGWVCAP